MAKRAKLPRWQKGSREYEFTLPAAVTERGKEEKMRLGFSWDVRPTQPMTERGRTKWEMQCAHDLLGRAAMSLDGGQWFRNDLVLPGRA